MPTESEFKQTNIKGVITIVVVLVALIYGCNSILCNKKKEIEDVPSDRIAMTEFFENQRVTAFTMSQEFVKKELKSPSTAEFPANYKEACEFIGDSTFIINSYVDSQNSFSAMMRTNYQVKVKYIGKENWSLIDLKFEK